MRQKLIRRQFLGALDHIDRVLTKMIRNSGSRALLSSRDVHDIAEGLFLSAWTHWERFTRDLLVEDVATSKDSKLHREVRVFRRAASSWRLANLLLSHPDHPERFVEWSDYALVLSRANEFLGAGNRFASRPLPRRSEVDLLRRVRNVIAHRSDKAWDSFMKLCVNPPFSLTNRQTSRITPGRFLVSHSWNGRPIVREALGLLETAAWTLVP